jgi:arylsulfatase A-like enzyme
VGGLYGLTYFAIELISASALVQWVGGTVAIFKVIAPDLAWYVPGYALLGAAASIPASLAARLLKPYLPRRAGAGADGFFLAVAFSMVAWLWNPESYLPRYAYVLIAFASSAPVTLALAAAGWMSRRFNLSGRWDYALGGLSVSVVLVVSFLLLASPPEPERAREASRGAPGTRPNVVMIVVDTLRRDRVSAHGYPRATTPAIDRIAEEGTLFERATTTETWTLPAHASLFTGLYPREHQAHIEHPVLDARHRTLAERLQEAGYSTAGYSANPWVSSVAGLDQGFGELRYLGVETTTGFLFLSLVRARLLASDLGSREVTDATLRFLDGAASEDRPFFLFANYMEAHEPYGTFPEPYFSTYLDEPLPRDIGQEWVRDTIRFQCLSCTPDAELEAQGLVCSDGRWRISRERLEQEVALYDAGVLYVDHQIGRVYERLRELGLLDDTMIVVTSDHGESLGERGQMGHGAFLYQSVLEVPLVIRYPKLFPEGSRILEPVSLVDVLPTVLDAVELGVSTDVSGRSLVPGRSSSDRVGVLAEYVPYATDRVSRATSRWLDCDFSAVGRVSVSLQIGTVKLIWNADGRHELFHLDSSPREEDDRFGRDPELDRTMMAALEVRLSALQSGSPVAPAPELDEETLRALRALGYVR